MIVELKSSAPSKRTFEARAQKMRETWGDNTIVWFSRGWIIRVYGKDAEIMEDICNLTLEFDNTQDRLLGQFTINDQYRLTPPLVKAGYKIALLKE